MSLVVVFALISAVVGLAVTHSGVPASAMRLLTGQAWLENASAGTVSHVNGYTGGTDAQSAVGRPGDPFEVVQRPQGAFVLDLRTGRLSRLDDSSLNVTTSVTEPTPAKALQVITGAKATWILDKSSGVLQQVNPTTLKPLGHQIALGGPTGTGVVDGSGSLWVPLRSKVGVDQIRPGGALTHHALGRAGDDIQVADTSAGVWAVDARAETAASLSVPSAHHVSLPELAKVPLVSASGSSPDLVLVSASQVLNVNTAQQSLSSLALPAAASVTQVAVSSGQAYLLDPWAHRLDTVDLSPMGIVASTPVPAGADQLVAKDQLVFVNSTTTPQALVVNSHGGVTDVRKYTPHVSPRPMQGEPTIAPTPNTSPSPGPAPSLSPQPFPSATSPSQGLALLPTPQPAPSAAPPSQTSAPAPVELPSPQSASSATAPPQTPAPVPVPPPTAPPPTAAPPTAPRPTVPPPTAPRLAPPTTPAPTVPGTPAVTKVTAGNGQVTVTWSPPASDGGSPVVRYQVTASPRATSVSVASPNTTATLGGLTNGTSECVQVQAVNQVGGGPLSPAGQSCATPNPPPAVPGAVTNLAVTSGNGELTVSWGPAGVQAGSPPVTGYELSVGGGSPRALSSPATLSAPAWATETVSVYAVNAVGKGNAVSASGMAWGRSGTVTCVDILSGDRSVENGCIDNPGAGNAWQVQPSSITWINSWSGNGGHVVTGGFEYLCSDYSSGSVSGNQYALVNTPTAQACTSALPGYQNIAPNLPHVIASVSSASLGAGSQHICEYEGQTTGTNGTFNTEELSPCGAAPSGLQGARPGFDFWT